MNITFRGGVHPDDCKEYSRDAALTVYEPSGDLVFPVSQHIGKPAKILVKKGDPVLVGQKIADNDGYISADIHSSVSGKVKAIERRRTVAGSMVDCIVVENDGLYNTVEGFGEDTDYTVLDRKQILFRIREAGIVGMGGAGFPTPVKLEPRNPDAINYVIVNGAECEPYITCDDQLMRTHAAEIVTGLKIILKLFDNAEGVILIEDNKPEAIEAMKSVVGSQRRIRVQVAPKKYPQGGERAIMKVVTGLDTKLAVLPADYGCIINNVGTVYAIYEAICKNIPLIRRAVTVTGPGINNPSNLIARLGTSCRELIEAAGGFKEGEEIKKILSGGPMMGIAMSSIDVPLQKGNNAITVLTEDPVEIAEEMQTACIRCGRCNRACPVGLIPQEMQIAAEKKDYDRYENKLYGLECIQCGSCTYVCPAKRPLMVLFKHAKTEILAIKRAEQAKAAAEKALADKQEKESLMELFRKFREEEEKAARKATENETRVQAIIASGKEEK